MNSKLLSGFGMFFMELLAVIALSINWTAEVFGMIVLGLAFIAFNITALALVIAGILSKDDQRRSKPRV